MQRSSKIDLFEHIEVVVARCTVRAKRDADAFRQKSRHGSDSARQFHIAARIMCDTNAVSLDDVDIFIVKVHAMRS